MKFDQTLMNFVQKDLDRNLIPMLLGEPGIGKSSWLTALADIMHTKCFILPCNQLADKADLTGARLVPVVDDEGNTVSYKQVFYPHAVIHDAIEYANAHPRETPILFMDELNRTTPDVTSEALSIPTLRAIGSISLPDNLRVVIAGNDKGNVTSLDEASISRFVLYHVEPDTITFLSLDPELNPFVKKVLEQHPETIFCKKIETIVAQNDDDNNNTFIEDIIDDGEDMNQITTPRTIMGLSRWLNTFSSQELLNALSDTRLIDGMQVSVLQEAIEGHVGNTDFTKFLLNEIATNVNNINNQAAVISLTKPPVYDDFKNCPDRTALNDFITNLSGHEKSAILTYLLYEKQDNTTYVEAIAPHIGNEMNPTDVQHLSDLSKVNGLDAENVHTLLNTNTAIATLLNMLLSNY